MKRGAFITFEGCDGCGKTTAINNVYTVLVKKGYDVVLTREPGGSSIAEEIRSIILDQKNTDEDKRTEALLYAASRRQHLVDVILPALKEGKLVICDRYLDSSLAYQGYAREIGIEEVLKINEFAIAGLYPDLTFYLDLSPEKGLERMRGRTREADRLDVESLDFHKRVYKGYEIVNAMFKERVVNIDASQSPEEIADAIVLTIESRYGSKDV